MRNRRMGSRRWTAALAVGAVLILAGPGAAAAPDVAGSRHCVWRLTQLPTGGRDGGEVRGTDGGDRWVGLVGLEAAQWRRGRLTVLGPGRAADVSRRGIVVGADQGATNQGHAVLWRSGRRIRLAEPAGTRLSMATAINDRGMIVGWGTATSEEEWHGPGFGLVWSASTPWRYTRVTYQDLDVVLTDVSDDGLLVGIAQRPWSETGPWAAVVGTVRGGLRPLAPHAADSAAYATAGPFIIGTTDAGGVIWRLGRRAVTTLPTGLMPTDVNSAGTVAILDQNTYRPAVWHRSKVTPLPVPRGWSAFAGVINEAGQVAGGLSSAGPDGAPVVWSCRP